MLSHVILALLVAVVSAIEDGEKAFFAMGNPSFQPMAKQWMPSLNSMGFEDDELRFRNNMGLAGIGGFAGRNDDFFFGGFDDFGENIRFGGLSGLAGTARLGFDDDDGLRTMASFRSTFRAPVLPQGQPVARRISAPFRGYYGDDNDDMFEDFYMMNGFMGAPMGMGMMGAGFRPPYGGTFNFQMRGMFPQMGMGAMGPGMVGMPQALPSPFMMNPMMMRRPVAGPMMMGPMMGGQGPFNPASMAFGRNFHKANKTKS